jgi:hypothetical protein
MASAFTSAADDGDEETRVAFQKALEDFKMKCSERSLQTFENMTSREVKIQLLCIQRDQERLKAMMNFRRIQCFILRMEEFNKILQGFVNGPYYLSYVWGAMEFLLQVSYDSNCSSTPEMKPELINCLRQPQVPYQRVSMACWPRTRDSGRKCPISKTSVACLRSIVECGNAW